MAAKKQPRSDVRQSLLIVYVGVCVAAVVLTVVIAFAETSDLTQAVADTPTATRTLSPLVLTQQAEGSVNDDLHRQSTATPAPAETAEPPVER